MCFVELKSKRTKQSADETVRFFKLLHLVNLISWVFGGLYIHQSFRVFNSLIVFVRLFRVVDVHS